MMHRQLALNFPPSLFISLLASLVPGFPCATAVRGAAPFAVEVVTSFPGASAEEVERQVTIPLEVTLAGMPGLRSTSSRSLFGLSQLALQFEDGTDRFAARQKVIDRLQRVENLPPGAVPQIGPGFAPVLLRYTLSVPKTDRGEDIYTSNDLRALQDWALERELRRVPRVLDVSAAGGTVKRYEVHFDPDRLRSYGITLPQLQKGIAEQNASAGSDLLRRAPAVRDIGLLGGGLDPVEKAVTLKTAREAARLLRNEEERRLREIRKIVVATINRVPVRVEDLVQGGPLAEGASPAGVVVSHAPRCGQVGLSQGRHVDEDDVVQGVVLLRPGEDAGQALRAVRARIKALNDTPARLLPGVRILPHDESTPAAAKQRLWIEADFPGNTTFEAAAHEARKARKILSRHEEIETVVSRIGAGNDLCHSGLNKVWLLALLRPVQGQRTRAKVIEALHDELGRELVGVSWRFADRFRDEMLEAFVAAPGEVLVKIKGPDLEELERLAQAARRAVRGLPGIEEAHVVPLRGQSKVELAIDASKCRRWAIKVDDVGLVIQAALDGVPAAKMIEGNKQYDITLRWPASLRANKEALLDIPVDAGPQEMERGPRVRLRALLATDREEKAARPGVAVIYRENGRRLIAVRLRVKDGEAARVMAEGRKRTADLERGPYRMEWTAP